jgi:mono/diheme cytochrome c family protein
MQPSVDQWTDARSPSSALAGGRDWLVDWLAKRALAVSVLAAMISLGGALLIARPIQFAMGVAGASATQAAQDAFATLVSTPQLVAEGAGFFGQSCGDCHGDDARGDEGPDLHGLAISNGRIAATIKHGVKGQMPSFARKYGDAQIAALVAYVRSLR